MKVPSPLNDHAHDERKQHIPGELNARYRKRAASILAAAPDGSGAAALCDLDQRSGYLAAPLVAVIFSMASLTVKLAALARGGNSLNVSRYFPTIACTGTSRNARWACQLP